MKKTISTVFLLVFCIVVNAQDISKIPTDSSQKMTTPDAKCTLLNQNSIQIGLGTTGISVDYRHRFTSLIGLRIGGAMLPGISNADITNTLKLEKRARSKMDVELNNTHLLVEFSPFNGKGVRLITGLGYFATANGKVHSYFVDSVGITNTKSLSPAEIGTIDATIDYGGQIAPYFGLGFGSPVPKHRVGFNVDLGFYYLQAPNVTSICTNALALNNGTLSPSLKTQLKTYIYLPNIQFNLNIRL